jgi:hypothetical protein
MFKSVGLTVALLGFLGLADAGPITITQSCSGSVCLNTSEITGLGSASLFVHVRSSGSSSNGSASGGIEAVIDVYSTGPVRPGQLKVIALGQGDASFGSGSGGGDIAGLVDWAGGFLPGSVNSTFPFTLGVPFEIDVDAGFGCFSGLGCSGGGDSMATIMLLDGGIPVSIIGLPEPTTLLLAASGLGIFISCSLLRRQSRSRPIQL